MSFSGHRNGGLTYCDFGIRKLDNLAMSLGYFPNAEQLATWYCQLLRDAGDDVSIAFVNSGDFELLYENPWYIEHKAMHSVGWLTATGKLND